MCAVYRAVLKRIIPFRSILSKIYFSYGQTIRLRFMYTFNFPNSLVVLLKTE